MSRKETIRFFKHSSAKLLIVAAVMTVSILSVGQTRAQELDEYAFEEYDTVTTPASYEDEGTNMETGTDTGNIFRTETADLERIDYKTKYDSENEVFYTAVDGYSETALASNVMDGMYVQDAVWISIANGLSWSLYKDGIVQTEVNLDAITEPGAYILAMYDGDRNPVQPLAFTMIGDYTNLGTISLPTSYTITSLSRGGVMIDTEITSAQLSEEGNYVLTYTVPGIKKPVTLRFEVDRTAPTLELSDVDEDGYARGPVDISDMEDGISCLITVGDKRVDYQSILTDSGRYTITLADQAGNATTYKFTIKIYFNYLSYLFFLLLIGIVVGMIVYIRIARKRLRVR